ncbi:MAG: hypothetical protein A3J65_00495 [Candidatus Buchananbacteria bacterium RIFCSPHIGHO2_02_FULL_45_11b]|uniref:Uncharacterized protein n=4 Tax=Candidatus Buchananiibacteriota TaxID=1817903 RepID=A0A1G1Y4X9_9BACT|nr:MAG: hypothetical protein A2663_01110 [Candidatus Buchananbacteria bacterium RIFCSPHIGHO2_01_FULL_46_12]OGY49808.1 MAG: hypothetical protein A3J65_00495 [Candidatus Buchananbacteria bacterium RIFCSPHIGHO2_02_FULL_45_11b]OGY53605.1 MAG: hypothetical protein A3B15_03465 [Candidatus Buchananbacteria bacterium RIFCSPLOWO2_01_FULL_45_31]OGY57360.1 MAG: hypothetical protein A3H67_04445 [Candidatus Buchananbacteria bacterium RIFCSPLOWO2_02_FULL_46_11b]
MPAENKINEFLERVEKIKKEHKFDLSSDEDLSIAVMNIISLEEHFFFTAAKTGKDKYYDLLFQVREMRKDLLKKIVKDAEGEQWCISKHLLAASMRLIEVGTKYYAQNRKEEAKDLFSKAYNLYSLFFGINLKLIDSKETKQAAGLALKANNEKEDDLTKKLNNLVAELVNCCDE